MRRQGKGKFFLGVSMCQSAGGGKVPTVQSSFYGVKEIGTGLFP